jgi:hypothetical protein
MNEGTPANLLLFVEPVRGREKQRKEKEGEEKREQDVAANAEPSSECVVVTRERSRAVEEQLHVIVFTPLRRNIASDLLLRPPRAPLLALRPLSTLILVGQLVEHPRDALAAPCKRVTHRTIVPGSQGDRVKSAESRIAEDPRRAGAGPETGGLETAVQEGVGCKGGRGAGLRT